MNSNWLICTGTSEEMQCGNQWDIPTIPSHYWNTPNEKSQVSHSAPEFVQDMETHHRPSFVSHSYYHQDSFSSYHHHNHHHHRIHSLKALKDCIYSEERESSSVSFIYGKSGNLLETQHGLTQSKSPASNSSSSSFNSVDDGTSSYPQYSPEDSSYLHQNNFTKSDEIIDDARILQDQCTYEKKEELKNLKKEKVGSIAVEQTIHHQELLMEDDGIPQKNSEWMQNLNDLESYIGKMS